MENASDLFNRPPNTRRTQADWDAAYQERPPWDTGRPQPAFLALARAGRLRGRVLDVGCGTGEHALMAAALGLESIGVDLSALAIDIASSKALDRGLAIRFVVADVLELSGLNEKFDTVLDSAVFHLFDDENRERFVTSLKTALQPCGRYFMLCFSDRQPGAFGPRRVSEAEIRQAFQEGWRIDSIEPVKVEANGAPGGIEAWLVAATRVD